MAVWDSISSAYIEVATTALPLHRLGLFVSGVLGVLSVKSQTHLSVLETLGQSKLSDLTSLDSRLLAHATLGDLVVGMLLVAIGWIGVRALLMLVFSLAGKSTDLWDRSKAALQDAQPPRSEEARKAAIQMLDASLKEPQSRLRTLTAMSEMLCGVGIGLVFVSWWGNVIDLVVGLAFLALTVCLVFRSVWLFVAEVFGPAMIKTRLQGRTSPMPWESF